MTLPIPNLDDRTFDQLVAEARSLIPKNYPTWTDHNLSDPGMALLELFAFLTEAVIYQTNQIPDRTLEHFAALVGEQRQITADGQPEAIEATLGRAIAALKRLERATTVEDFATLVQQAFESEVARVEVRVEGVDTLNVYPDEQVVNVVLVPNDTSAAHPEPSDDLRQRVFEHLRDRRLITTRVRVIAPTYTSISLDVTVVREGNSPLTNSAIQQQLVSALHTFLSPLTGGEAGTGWPFGRSIRRSELYQAIETVAGVDHVRRLTLRNQDDAEVSGDLAIAPTALVSLPAANLTVTVVER
jgi:hypothetical protein